MSSCCAPCAESSRGFLADVPIESWDSDAPTYVAPGVPSIVSDEDARPNVVGRKWTKVYGTNLWASVPDTYRERDIGRRADGSPAIEGGPLSLFTSKDTWSEVADTILGATKSVGQAFGAVPGGFAGGAAGGAAGAAVRNVGQSFVDQVTGKSSPGKPGELPKWLLPAAVGGVLLLLVLRR